MIAFTSWGNVQHVYCNYFPGCDLLNFEINLIFRIKSFYYTTIESREKCKYIENEKSF